MSQQQKLWVALVKERLYNLGWSQTQLAESVGVAKATIPDTSQLNNKANQTDFLKR
ncbi:XRE family transcriptional regulator [Streptococcus sp. HMSC071H03]|uniref:XRE family transcriptional regulator n=1 Tax=Streptococcus sp. HMSC071H03 TaxID=1739391 RepID=UPI0011D0DAC6|nr:XRE family transcriptional regulator [Streptococcus sp. HMSC071H03]